MVREKGQEEETRLRIEGGGRERSGEARNRKGKKERKRKRGMRRRGTEEVPFVKVWKTPKTPGSIMEATVREEQCGIFPFSGRPAYRRDISRSAKFLLVDKQSFLLAVPLVYQELDRRVANELKSRERKHLKWTTVSASLQSQSVPCWQTAVPDISPQDLYADLRVDLGRGAGDPRAEHPQHRVAGSFRDQRVHHLGPDRPPRFSALGKVRMVGRGDLPDHL